MNRKVPALVGCFLGLYLCMFATVAVGQGRITKATLGTELTITREIDNPTTEFTADTQKIYCAWVVEGLKSDTVARGVFIAEDVGDVAPRNYKIDEATVTVSASTHKGNFSLSKPYKGFPVGKYRVEIYLGEDLAKIVPFTVKAK